MPPCVPLQELLTECRESDEAGEAVISRRDAATRGIAAALQVAVLCKRLRQTASYCCNHYPLADRLMWVSMCSLRTGGCSGGQAGAAA
jgi:hypothetical protein